MIFINPDAKSNKDIPNIGLAYAATYYNTKVIDLNTMPLPKDRFLKYKTEVIGISIQSRTYNEAKRIGQLYKQKYPESKIKSISGFLDVQCCYPYLDFEEKIECNKPFSDQYPFPNYELFDSFTVFQQKWEKGYWGYAIMTSQGCPYQCIYCVSRNRKWLARSPENCYEELKQAKEKWNIKHFSILDDCFNVDITRALKFCELVKPLNLKWTCANGLRADRFNEDMAKAMAESGCVKINFGIESTDSEVLKTIRKGEKIEDIELAIDIAVKYFKKSTINGFFIIGLPGSSYQKDLASIKWAQTKNIQALFSYYLPFNKTVQYDKLFYGDFTEPLSDTYPKKQQKKLYQLAHSIWQSPQKPFIKKLFSKII